MTTNEQVQRIDKDIGRLSEKIKAYQQKIAQLTERKKKLQERGLLEQLNEIAPDYEQAEKLLQELKAARETDGRNGGVSS